MFLRVDIYFEAIFFEMVDDMLLLVLNAFFAVLEQAPLYAQLCAKIGPASPGIINPYQGEILFMILRSPDL